MSGMRKLGRLGKLVANTIFSVVLSFIVYMLLQIVYVDSIGDAIVSGLQVGSLDSFSAISYVTWVYALAIFASGSTTSMVVYRDPKVIWASLLAIAASCLVMFKLSHDAFAVTYPGVGLSVDYSRALLVLDMGSFTVIRSVFEMQTLFMVYVLRSPDVFFTVLKALFLVYGIVFRTIVGVNEHENG